MTIHKMPSDAAAVARALGLDADELALLFEREGVRRLRSLARRVDRYDNVPDRDDALGAIQHVFWIADAFWELSAIEEEKEATEDFTGGDPEGVASVAAIDGSEAS